jgi:hypothetical protein
VMVSPVEHQMTVESPTNGQPPAAANSAERDSLPTVEQREMDHLRADGATFGSLVGMLTHTWLATVRIASPARQTPNRAPLARPDSSFVDRVVDRDQLMAAQQVVARAGPEIHFSGCRRS